MSNTCTRLGKLSVGLLLVVLISRPQAILGQVTTNQLANVATEYDNLFLSAPYPDGFGIPLKAQAVLNVTYPSGTIALGKAYTADQVKTQPTITVIPTNLSGFKTPNAFTLMLADANALGNPDKEGNYRHFLQNGATFGDAGRDGSMAMNAGSGTVVTNYAGPGPLPETGVHRYAWMLFAQPPAFQAPSNLSTAGVAPSHWDVNSYVSSTGLGDLVAASFFTVQNGDAKFPHSATVSHISTPSAANNQTATNASTQSNGNNSTNPARNSATSGHQGPIWMDSFGLVKNVIMGFAITFSGFIVAQ